MNRRVILSSVLFVFVLALGAATFVFWLPNTYPEPGAKIVVIPRGSTYRSIVDSLANSGAIRSKLAFQIAGRVLGYTKSIKVGKYLFVSGLSNLDILRDIGEGKSRMITSVSIPEGWRIEAIANKYGRDLGIDAEKFLAICRDSVYLHKYGIEARSLEGYLLPETYNFYWQTDEQEIVERMVQAFQGFYVDSLHVRQHEVGLTTAELLTLASIVEGESGIPEERPVVAGVYWNRLRKHMRLEADPTIQYVLKGGPRRLTFQDLKLNSPYNTYLNIGLPPGPINNPGKQSILAALYPESNPYLYFVATGVGGHRFSIILPLLVP
jgi:UPF0755 protein